MKTLVVYHRADFDGIFCREIAKKFLGTQDVEYIGWDYGDSEAIVPLGVERIYMLDISVQSLMNDPRLIWIDHHKSAMEKFPSTIPGYRIDGVAACRLAWQWFALMLCGPRDAEQAGCTKKQFVARNVVEPLAVRLAGEYDIWDKRDPRADLFQHGLRSRELGPDTWDILLSGPTAPEGDKQGLAEIYVEALLDAGEAIQYVATQQNASIIQAYGFTVLWEGLTFLCCNHARFNSHLFTAGIEPNVHEALLGFNYDGSKDEWRVSLYHCPGHERHDLSLIAKKYGGGGHRGACGFRLKELPRAWRKEL